MSESVRPRGAAGAEPEAPKITFPCNYPIRIVGNAIDDFQRLVLDIVEVHAPGVDLSQVSVRDSRNGRFLSVTVHITATGEDQLKALFEDLKATGHVHMVL